MLPQRFAPLLLLPALLLVPTTTRAADGGPLGKQIEGFALNSHYGKQYSLAGLAEQDIVVVAFLGTECPLAKLYGPRLAELAKQWDPARVAVIGIDSNQQDSIQEIAAYAHRSEIEFPILKDPGNVVADQFGAGRTPEVFVLDRERAIRYHGRIDDQYGFDKGVGYQRPAPTRRDLDEAVRELLDGKPVSVATTDIVGCHIGRVRPVDEDADVTYSNQISRIFQQHCVECHREGQIGPFVMTNYEDVVGWGEMIREVVDEGRMPPWHANPQHGSFLNDMRLSDEDRQLIHAWVQAGCPEGDASQLPPQREFAEGWVIGEPDEIIYMSEQPVNVPAEGVIDYYHFVVDPGWTEDKWIMAAEARPGSLETVHHILVFIRPPSEGGPALGRRSAGDPQNGNAADSPRRSGDRGQFNREEFQRRRAEREQAGEAADQAERPRGRGDNPRGRGNRRGQGDGDGDGGGGGLTNGNLIAGYAPGMNPMLHTDGSVAMRIPAGSRLIFQMHYTPNGTPQQDLSYVGFKFADPEKVQYVARSTAIVNPFFAIPPGAEDYSVSADTTFEHDTLITNMTPHMHTRGKAFTYTARYPDGTEEILLDIPRYDFNWQTTYYLAEPKLMPQGTQLTCTAHWDNSENNLANPDPTKVVSWGDQTWEEMMIGFYVEQFPKDDVPPETSGIRNLGRFDPDKIFDSLDANGDGQLTAVELPDMLSERMNMADLNKDGHISRQELKLILGLLNSMRGRD